MSLRYLVLTGAESGARIIMEIGTIKHVYEQGLGYATGLDSELEPLEHTRVLTTNGFFAVKESFDQIYDAMNP